MASVEYAVKYPKNEELEKRALEFSEKHRDFVTINDDWTKLCLTVKDAFKHQKLLEKAGFYAEFCDGKTIMFYLSPATKTRDFTRLCKTIEKLIATAKPCPSTPQTYGVFEQIDENSEVEWVTLDGAENRICAKTCGLFPPCVPLIRRGEKIEKEKLELLKTADNTFGVQDGKIAVVKQK
jgi:arginine/lysine/ornithine decarboxylase